MHEIAVLGASHGAGAALLLLLAKKGLAARGLARCPQKAELLQARAAALGLPVLDISTGDAGDPGVLADFLAGADCIINCIDGERQPEVPRLIEASPGLRFIMLGSARIHSRFPDARSLAVQKLSAEVLARPWRATLVHPSMMYGWRRDNRTVAVLQKLLGWRIFPLAAGFPARVQPLHAADAALGIVAVMQKEATVGKELLFAGPQPLAYADFVRQCAKGRRIFMPALPLPLLRVLARLVSMSPLGPKIAPGMLTRLTEDRVFPENALPELGIQPRSLSLGLTQITEV